METSEIIIAVASIIFASTGFWAFLENRMSTQKKAKNATNKMLIGLAHDRILYLGQEYIKRGNITVDEYDNLVNYLYEPYKALGGNGTAERVINAVKQLPIDGGN